MHIDLSILNVSFIACETNREIEKIFAVFIVWKGLL